MAEEADGRGAVDERVRGLVEALRATPAMERFRLATERFRTDAELRRLQAGALWIRERIQAAERQNRHDPNLFMEARETNARLQRHPLVIEFLEAREEAQDLMRAANLQMATVLGFDIAASVGRGGGCC